MPTMLNERSAYPLKGSPLSKAQLRRITGMDPIYHFLSHYAIRDMVLVRDDFTGVALDTTNNWTVANGGGAAVASFAQNVQENGAIRATTGTANGDTTTCSLVGPKTWIGSRFPSVEIRWKPITAVTETRIELGFVDVIPGSNKPIANSLTTPTVNTSVASALIDLYDHTGSTTTNEFLTIGSAVSAAKSTFTAPNAITAATYVVSRIHNMAGYGYLWRDGILMAQPAAVVVTAADALAIAALIRASNATSKSLDLDYVLCAANRL